MPDANAIKLISCEGLKEKLDRGEDFKLVMTYHEWAYRAKHIPGSLNIHSEESAKGLIQPTDEIVVYCVNQSCQASVQAYRSLSNHGFTNIQRFAGGLQEWEEKGFPLEGEQVEKNIEPDDKFTL